ncbi:hypothetical protein PGB90_005286 [Kerria lacca]
MKPINLIAAVSENNGIGIKGNLPWKLKKETEYYIRMTTQTKNTNKMNAVIMGRKTWDSVPSKYKPFSNRLNIVISQNEKNIDERVLIFKNVSEAVDALQNGFPNIETIWIIGGHGIYKEALDKKLCDKLYITKIKKKIECDTFFPHYNENDFSLIEEPGVPTDIQKENGLCYEFKIFQKKH